MVTKQGSQSVSPLRRVYVDLPSRVALKLDNLAAEAGMTKKAFLADLITKAADRADKRDARAS